jgi:alpha-tubulin suppressor-like RCC1 family protein
MIDANDGYGPASTRTGVRWRRRLPRRAAIATTAALIAGGVLATPTKAAADPAEFVAVYSWGNNPVGQLGDGTEDPRLEPGPVGLPEGVLITKIEAEAYGSMALTADGQVYGWGTNQSWQLAIGGPVDGSVPVLLDLDQPEGTRFTDIAAGYSGHRLALTSSGTVIAWGADQEGEAGNGSDTDYSLYDPVVAQLPSGVHATAIAAGYDTSFAITSDNRLYAWGGNDDGQLGDGTTHQRTTPVTVDLTEGNSILSVAPGQRFTAALTTDGTVLAWGNNYYAQLGTGSHDEETHPIPAAVPLADDVRVVQLDAGNSHVIALTDDGRVFSWGSRQPIHEVTMPSGTQVRSVAAGGSGFDFALTTTGQVLAWGQNGFGQLGDGSVDTRDTPVAVHLPAGAPVTALAASPWHVLAATAAFPDVAAANPFLADVNWLARYNVTAGFPNGTFRPTAPITRGQMAIYLYRYAHGGEDATGCSGAPFPDVPATSTACGAIEWLSDLGITQGGSDGRFHPGDAVSRQAMAAFLYRYFYGGEPPLLCLRGITIGGVYYPFPPPFPDVSDASPFWCSISWLKGAQPVGITGGYPDGTFRPTVAVSRQAMAAYLHRYFTDFYGYGAE